MINRKTIGNVLCAWIFVSALSIAGISGWVLTEWEWWFHLTPLYLSVGYFAEL